MTVLAVGLALFFVPHLVPMFSGPRAALVNRWGERGYRGGFSLVSAVGLLLIVGGYIYADKGPQLFAPLAAARVIAPWAMLLAFILFASSHAPSHLREAVKHPMLLGTLIWSAVHLAANGDLRGTVLTADYRSTIPGNGGGYGGRYFSVGYFELSRLVRRPWPMARRMLRSRSARGGGRSWPLRSRRPPS